MSPKLSFLSFSSSLSSSQENDQWGKRGITGDGENCCSSLPTPFYSSAAFVTSPYSLHPSILFRYGGGGGGSQFTIEN